MKPQTLKAIDLGVTLLSCLGLFLGLRLGQPVWYFAPALLLTARTLGYLLHEPDDPWDGLFSTLMLLAAFFLAPPDLSDDYHRYLWEGFAANQGYSPYRHSPESLYHTLDHPSEGLVNHDDLATIYPPLAQMAFRAAAWASTSVYSWKLLILLSFIPLYFVMERRLFLALVSCPAVLIEGVWNAHLDVAGLMPGVMLILALNQKRAGLTGALLAVLTAIKIMPLVFAPFCFFFFRENRDRLRLVGVFALVLGLVYAPYLTQWRGLFASFLKFSSEWYFNNPFFHALKAVTGENARTILSAGLLMALGSLLWIRRPIDWKLTGAWLAIIVCSPTVHPWYFLWLMFTTPQHRLRWAHVAYMAVFFSYLILIPYRANGLWAERFWWMIPEWLLLLFCFWNMLRTATPNESR